MPLIQRRSLHHGVDDRLLYGRFRLRDRARCHYETANGSVGAAGAALAPSSRAARNRQLRVNFGSTGPIDAN